MTPLIRSPERPMTAWLPALGWAGCIFVFSSFPGSAYPDTGVARADVMVHLGLYALLAGLCARGFLRGSALGLSSVMILASLISTIYGMSDELHQWFVPGRNADWWDVLADAVGSIVGAGVMVVVARRRRGGADRALR